MNFWQYLGRAFWEGQEKTFDPSPIQEGAYGLPCLPDEGLATQVTEFYSPLHLEVISSHKKANPGHKMCVFKVKSKPFSRELSSCSLKR